MDTVGIKHSKSLLWIALFFVIAFALRTGVGFGVKSEEEFWEKGYTHFDTIAVNLSSGDGFYWERGFGRSYADRPPLYPIFLATIYKVIAHNWIAVVLAQAFLGSVTAAIAYILGASLFSQRVAVLAGLLTAAYPYYVFHDTSLQETVLATTLGAGGVLAAVTASRRRSLGWTGAAGLLPGLAILSRTTILLGALIIGPWLAFYGTRSIPLVAQRLSVFVLGLALVVAPWVIRNQVELGTPVLTSDTGYQLWVGNNEHTFSRYPSGSIDESTNQAWAALGNEEIEQITAFNDDEIKRDGLFRDKAFSFMKENPGTMLHRMATKLVAGFSWKLNPDQKSLFRDLAYTLSYSPIMVLGIGGALLMRHRWREFVPIFGLFAAFIVTAVIFYTHTSHRSILDLYFIIFAAVSLEFLWERVIKPRVEMSIGDKIMVKDIESRP